MCATDMDNIQGDSLKMDSEFDQMLVEMRPHVLKLPHKSGQDLTYNFITDSYKIVKCCAATLFSLFVLPLSATFTCFQKFNKNHIEFYVVFHLLLLKIFLLFVSF